MTCNIDMLSDFFSTKNDVENDWFLEDYNNIMINEINNTFDNFGKYKVHILVIYSRVRPTFINL
jgi:hypothetical protein